MNFYWNQSENTVLFTISLKLSDMGAALALKMPKLQTKTKTEIGFILALISEGTSQTEWDSDEMWQTAFIHEVK